MSPLLCAIRARLLLQCSILTICHIALKLYIFFSDFFFWCIAHSLSFLSLGELTSPTAITWNFNWGKKFHPELRAHGLRRRRRAYIHEKSLLPHPSVPWNLKSRVRERKNAVRENKRQTGWGWRRNISTMWTFANDVFRSLEAHTAKKKRAEEERDYSTLLHHLCMALCIMLNVRWRPHGLVLKRLELQLSSVSFSHWISTQTHTHQSELHSQLHFFLLSRS